MRKQTNKPTDKLARRRQFCECVIVYLAKTKVWRRKRSKTDNNCPCFGMDDWTQISWSQKMHIVIVFFAPLAEDALMRWENRRPRHTAHIYMKSQPEAKTQRKRNAKTERHNDDVTEQMQSRSRLYAILVVIFFFCLCFCFCFFFYITASLLCDDALEDLFYCCDLRVLKIKSSLSCTFGVVWRVFCCAAIATCALLTLMCSSGFGALIGLGILLFCVRFSL